MNQTGNNIAQAAEIIAKTHSLLVITGAGISAESGLPTFRGPNGVLTKRPDLERVISARGLAENPNAVWAFIDELRVHTAAAKPNAAHQILAQWEQEGRFDRFMIATQNIDGLHQKAGSQRVSELHGSIWQFAEPRSSDYAEDEGFSDDMQDFLSGDNREALLRKWSVENQCEVWTNLDVPFKQIPPHADTNIRPNVVLYDESYGNRLLWVESFIAGKPDTVLVIGCSGGVMILHTLLDACRRANPGCQIININKAESCITIDHVDVRMSAVEAMTMLR